MANLPIQNTNLQAQAVIAAEGNTNLISSLVQDLERVDPKKEVKKIDLMEKLLEVGGSKDLTTQLLKDLMTKVAQAGIVFEGIKPAVKVENPTQKLEDNLEPEEFSDKVEITSKKGSEEDPLLPIKIGGSRNQLFNFLKESAILYYLEGADNKIRQIIRRRGFAELLEKAGKELGKEAAEKAQAEVRGFVLEELENQLIKRTFLQDGNFKDCYKLVKIGEKVGLDSLEWMKNIWPQKKENHGLNLLDIPHEVTGYVNVKDNDPQARREREKFEYQEEDEKDVILNRLRALYLQMILKPGGLRALATWFKIRKLKNGLLRLGVYTKDIDEKTKKEAKTLAKVKTLEMLEEALHEHASFFDEGVAKDLVANKIKNCFKNLERLGVELTDKDFVALRDKANRQMSELVQRELEVTQKQKGPQAEKKVAQLQKLLARLQKESNLGFREEA